jgi:predicted nucleic acid-binding protein
MMALYFFDSSALVKCYVHEQGSVWVREITANARDDLFNSGMPEEVFKEWPGQSDKANFSRKCF